LRLLVGPVVEVRTATPQTPATV
jgi:hypothetical protein